MSTWHSMSKYLKNAMEKLKHYKFIYCNFYVLALWVSSTHWVQLSLLHENSGGAAGDAINVSIANTISSPDDYFLNV